MIAKETDRQTVLFDFTSPTGLAPTQFRKIMERLNQMSEDLGALHTELADVRTSVDKIAASVAESAAANERLQARIDELESGQIVSQDQITALTTEAEAIAAGIRDATATAAGIDESAEDLSGENDPPAEPV